MGRDCIRAQARKVTVGDGKKKKEPRCLFWRIALVHSNRTIFGFPMARLGIFNPDATQFVATDKTCKLTAMLRSAAGKNLF